MTDRAPPAGAGAIEAAEAATGTAADTAPPVRAGAAKPAPAPAGGASATPTPAPAPALPDIGFRRAGRRDAVAVARLLSALMGELTGAAPAVPVPLMGRVLADPRSAGFLAEREGVPLGVLMLCEGVAACAGGSFGQITELYVAPDWRNAGIGSRLVMLAAAHGHAHGWCRLDAGLPPHPQPHPQPEPASLDFCRKAGFAPLGPRLSLPLAPAAPGPAAMAQAPDPAPDSAPAQDGR